MTRRSTPYERLARAIEFFADPKDKGGVGAEVVSYLELAKQAGISLAQATEIIDEHHYTLVALLPSGWDLVQVLDLPTPGLRITWPQTADRR